MVMIYCRECGARHSDKAKACPKCGYAAFNADKSVAIYLVLLWLFGMFGAHRFYAGKTKSAIVILLMFIGGILLYPMAILSFMGHADSFGVLCLCVGVPAIIATGIWVFVDFIIALCNIKHPEKIFADKK